MMQQKHNNLQMFLSSIILLKNLIEMFHGLSHNNNVRNNIVLAMIIARSLNQINP